MWLRRIAYFGLVTLLSAGCLSAQSPNGTINGLVLDLTGGAIVGAEIRIANDATGVQYTGKTNSEGIYVVTNLPPGPYRLQVSKIGFKTLIKPDIILNVQDSLAINFTLPVGAASEIITVTGGASIINTTNGSVSTVVDREYVENMPLNGRSFQDLILLTPGVVTNTPQTAYPTIGVNGEFSVNGQRTESNYYSVDGVSGNVGVFPGAASYTASSGSLPASTALGTTQGLVSVDDLEEFRVQSSTYSAEYGRNPGGQFSFATRSGTSEWHGSAFDYLRNDVFDSNDWFNDFYSVPKPALRQNDFGGTLGGPLEIPHWYEQKDKTFFFFSYEGLRLVQPQEATVSYVPDAALRQSAPAALQPVLNAFPIANAADLGNGLAEYIGTWSDPSQLNSTSIRFDHSFNEKLRLFFRFSDTGSESQSRKGGNFFSPSNVLSSTYTTRTYTLGATSLLSNRIGNEFRLNYSSNHVVAAQLLDSFGGAQAVNLAQLQQLPANSVSGVETDLYFSGYFTALRQALNIGTQRQWNAIDTLNLTSGKHLIKFGFDIRRLAPLEVPDSPYVLYDYADATSVVQNSVDNGSVEAEAIERPAYINFSAFVQDDWRLTERLSLSGGIRWEVNPAPGAARGDVPYTVQGLGDLATITLAPQGTPLWKTTWYNFAPRLGAAYIVRDQPGYETVVRGGGGVFFDTGQQTGSVGYNGPGFSALTFFGTSNGIAAGFPVSTAQFTPPIVNPPLPPYQLVAAYEPHLQLPYTLQWNLSIEQSLGKSQALTVSYVGSHGARLLQRNQISGAALNPNFTYLLLTRNGLTSDYNALQMQFQRRLSAGLTALASYTWSHCFDYGSNSSTLPYQRGNCDFDVRQNLAAAFSYSLPGAFRNGFARLALHDWGIDDRFTARTAFPVTLTSGNTVVNPGTGQNYDGGLNIVPGEPVYIYGSQCAMVFSAACPGGRAINPNAFSNPAPGAIGNAPRNFAYGFGAWQMDVAIRRDFPIRERLRLQFRAEAFNVFNHPNFGAINPYHCSAGPFCTFGQPTATLANSLGILSPLYQMGGPRSLQLALKLMF